MTQRWVFWLRPMNMEMVLRMFAFAALGGNQDGSEEQKRYQYNDKQSKLHEYHSTSHYAVRLYEQSNGF